MKPHLVIMALLSLLLAVASPAQEARERLPRTEENVDQAFEATADERGRRVVKVLRTTDKAQVNQFVPVAFELANVNPFAVVRFIRRPIEAEEGNWWTFYNVEGQGGIVLINVPIWLVDPMRRLIETIDREGLTSSAGDKRTLLGLRHRDPRDIARLAAAYMTSSATILADPAIGSVYLEDAPSGHDLAMKMIPEALDVPTQQVLLRAKVYEIELNNDGTIGLDFHAWKNGPGRNLFALGATSESFHSGRHDSAIAPVVSSSVDVNGLPGREFKNSGFNATYFYDVPSAYFDFLVTKGRARVLTAPSLTALNTDTARFDTGEQILYYLAQSTNDPGIRKTPVDPFDRDEKFPDNRTVWGTAAANVGVFVQMHPIIADQAITLRLVVSIVSHLGYDDAGAPMLQERDLETTISARPGAEYILGGMTRTRSIQTTRKVPILGSIPVLGWLFGGEITTAKKTMLVLAVSATPIDDFSGLGEAESETLRRVDTAGMNVIPMPDEVVGFDMMLLGLE